MTPEEQRISGAPLTDRTIDLIAEYCSSTTYDSLPDDVVHATTQRIVDALACAMGALAHSTPSIAARVAPAPSPSGVLPVGRLLGRGSPGTTLEAAAFFNTFLVRYLDFNDQCPGGHPSDVVGPLVTLAEGLDASGRVLTLAVATAYDVFFRLAEQVANTFRHNGWDQAFCLAMATTAGAVVLLGLDRQTAHSALSLTAVTSMALRATRAGELSPWKGAATAHAARNALFVTSLAAEGMTGPQLPVEGRHGLQDVVTGTFALRPFRTMPTSHDVTRTRLKYWPVEYNLQGPVWAGLALADWLGTEAIDSIDVATYWNAWHECASDPAKWDPRTRETADHSLPFVLAYTLQRGAFDVTAFEPETFGDQSLRGLMGRITVRVDDALDALHPATVTWQVTATTLSGRATTIEIVNPKGHPDNPMGDEDITNKFLSCATPELGRDRAMGAAREWWQISQDGARVRSAFAALSQAAR